MAAWHSDPLCLITGLVVWPTERNVPDKQLGTANRLLYSVQGSQINDVKLNMQIKESDFQQLVNAPFIRKWSAGFVSKTRLGRHIQ